VVVGFGHWDDSRLSDENPEEVVVKLSDREDEAEVSILEAGGSMWGSARLTPGRKN